MILTSYKIDCTGPKVMLKLHCTTGPAIENPDGTFEWWVEGKQLTEEEFKKVLKLKAFW